MGKVGEWDGLESGFDGRFAERSDRTPGGGIIDVLGGLDASFDRLNESVEHEEIHTAMSSAFGILTIALPERVVVFGEPGVGRIPLIVRFALSFDVDAFGDIHP